MCFIVSSFHLNAFRCASTTVYLSLSLDMNWRITDERYSLLLPILTSNCCCCCPSPRLPPHLTLKWYKREHGTAREKALHFVNWIHRVLVSSHNNDDTGIGDDDGSERRRRMFFSSDRLRYNLRWLWKLLSFFQDSLYSSSSNNVKWGNKRYRFHNIDNQQSLSFRLRDQVNVFSSFQNRCCRLSTAAICSYFGPVSNKTWCEGRERGEKVLTSTSQRMIDMIEFDLVSTIF